MAGREVRVIWTNLLGDLLFSSKATSPDVKRDAPIPFMCLQVALFPATRNGSIVFVRFVVPGSASSDVPPPIVSYGISAEHLDKSSR